MESGGLESRLQPVPRHTRSTGRPDSVRGRATEHSGRPDSVRGRAAEHSERPDSVRGRATEHSERPDSVRSRATEHSERPDSVRGRTTEHSARPDGIRGQEWTTRDREIVQSNRNEKPEKWAHRSQPDPRARNRGRGVRDNKGQRNCGVATQRIAGKNGPRESA